MCYSLRFTILVPPRLSREMCGSAAGIKRGGGLTFDGIFALGAMTQLMRLYRGASIAG
ncbi:hypothetical protein DAI22_06g069200 [Oryza sativa Japonica Group]|nr:hypothetical protein DAI22_06g069200 [Oryza sativa Japonica Group]